MTLNELIQDLTLMASIRPDLSESEVLVQFNLCNGYNNYKIKEIVSSIELENPVIFVTIHKEVKYMLMEEK